MTHLDYTDILENISDRLFRNTTVNLLMIQIFEKIEVINIEDISRTIIKNDIEDGLIIMNSSLDVTNYMLPYYE